MARDYYFVVVGVGTFPIEMLRYDRCLPASEDDSYTAMRDDRSDRGARRVLLVGTIKPTVKRWESFTWQVVAGPFTQRYEGEDARGDVFEKKVKVGRGRKTSSPRAL